MSRRRPSTNKRGSRAEVALSELCGGFGYIVPGEARDSIFANPPADAEAFLDAVIAADGNDPTLKHPYSKQDPELAIVNDWLYDEHGRGPSSGLPRFPSNPES